VTTLEDDGEIGFVDDDDCGLGEAGYGGEFARAAILLLEYAAAVAADDDPECD